MGKLLSLVSTETIEHSALDRFTNSATISTDIPTSPIISDNASCDAGVAHQPPALGSSSSTINPTQTQSPSGSQVKPALIMQAESESQPNLNSEQDGDLTLDRAHRILRAKNLIARAATLLSPLGEDGSRASWMLEDCLALVDELAPFDASEAGGAQTASLAKQRAKVIPFPVKSPPATAEMLISQCRNRAINNLGGKNSSDAENFSEHEMFAGEFSPPVGQPPPVGYAELSDNELESVIFERIYEEIMRRESVASWLTTPISSSHQQL